MSTSCRKERLNLTVDVDEVSCSPGTVNNSTTFPETQLGFTMRLAGKLQVMCSPPLPTPDAVVKPECTAQEKCSSRESCLPWPGSWLLERPPKRLQARLQVLIPAREYVAGS